jgi:hypothetical protein
MLVHCGSCKHEWFALKLPMLMREASEKLMNLECPHCTRRSKIYCGPAPVGEKTTDDLVKRLRSLGSAGPGRISFLASEDAIKAASRIEKLEAALREIAALGFWDGDSAMSIARKALDAK